MPVAQTGCQMLTGVYPELGHDVLHHVIDLRIVAVVAATLALSFSSVD